MDDIGLTNFVDNSHFVCNIIPQVSDTILQLLCKLHTYCRPTCGKVQLCNKNFVFNRSFKVTLNINNTSSKEYIM